MLFLKQAVHMNMFKVTNCIITACHARGKILNSQDILAGTPIKFVVNQYNFLLITIICYRFYQIYSIIRFLSAFVIASADGKIWANICDAAILSSALMLHKQELQKPCHCDDQNFWSVVDDLIPDMLLLLLNTLHIFIIR